MNNIFINEFLTIGFDNITHSNTPNFEGYIVSLLVFIYGYEIKSAYLDKDEIKFQRIILKYGLKEEIYDNFLQSTTRFEEFKRRLEFNKNLRSDIPTIIETHIINMFLFKALSGNIVDDTKLENMLFNDEYINQIREELCRNSNQLRLIWKTKKKIIDNNVTLEEIKPSLLTETAYDIYGVNINDVKKMDPRMVAELNRTIDKNRQEEKDRRAKMTTKEKLEELANTPLSSGNGYVDALLVVSIIATELSLALIYIFLHWRF